MSKCISNPFNNTINILKLFLLSLGGLLLAGESKETTHSRCRFSSTFPDYLTFSDHFKVDFKFKKSLRQFFWLIMFEINLRRYRFTSHVSFCACDETSNVTLRNSIALLQKILLTLRSTKPPYRTNFKCHYIQVWGVETIKNTSTGTCSTSPEHRFKLVWKIGSIEANWGEFHKVRKCTEKIEVRGKVGSKVFIQLNLLLSTRVCFYIVEVRRRG